MTALDFTEWARAADRLLQLASPEMFANPALHPIRDHPALLLTSGLDARARSSTHIRRVARVWMGQVARSLRSVAGIKRVLRKAMNGEVPNGRRPVVLFVSHRLLDPGDSESDDRYFGPIPSAFESLVLRIDHRPGRMQIQSALESSARYVTIPPGLGLLSELRVLLQALRCLIEVLRRRWGEEDAVARTVLDAAFHRSTETITTLRIATAVGHVCEVLRPDAIVVTYEGHPWERLAFRAARTEVPDIVALGYPHAGILPGMHSIFRTLGGGLDPDGLLVPGEPSRRQIEARLPAMPVEVLGSPRRLEITAAEHDPGPICLVLPEGFASEVALLVMFALEVAKLLPEVDFRLRLHPLLRSDPTVEGLLKEIASRDNVRLSERSLVEDVRVARWCFYRGSTTAVMAAAAGVQPMYLHLPDSPMVDPLSAVGPAASLSPHRVASVEEAVGQMKAPVGEHQLPQISTEYFSVLDPAALRRLLDTVIDATSHP